MSRLDIKTTSKGLFTFDVIRFSAPRTTPSFVSTPMHDPALEIASMAYLCGNNGA